MDMCRRCTCTLGGLVAAHRLNVIFNELNCFLKLGIFATSATETTKICGRILTFFFLGI